MVTYITSKYGSIVIEGSFAVYTSEEQFCDAKGNPLKKGDPTGNQVADLIFKTANQRFIFPNLYFGLDCFYEINTLLEIASRNKKEKLYIDIHKLCEIVDIELIGAKSIIIENKQDERLETLSTQDNFVSGNISPEMRDYFMDGRK